MHPDHAAYIRYASRTNLTKSIETVAGVIRGIDIDGEITPEEMGFLYEWIDSHALVRNRHPFNEILPVVVSALEDGQLSEDEKLDILWLCDQLVGDHALADRVTSHMRQLHGILAGIVADGQVLEPELDGLRDWLSDHEHLRTVWPYDEIDSLVTSIMADHTISGDEHDTLLQFFSDFMALDDQRAAVSAPVEEQGAITGLCAVCPEIEFTGRVFCLTGASTRFLRKDLIAMIEGLGGEYSNSVSRRTDYLIVGADGNPCWAYACYGRKVEAAVRLRRAGSRLLIVHEHDFRDALEDNSAA